MSTRRENQTRRTSLEKKKDKEIQKQKTKNLHSNVVAKDYFVCRLLMDQKRNQREGKQRLKSQ